MNNVVGGVRKLSTSCDIFSVGHPSADTIGLPGGGILPLCHFLVIDKVLLFCTLYRLKSNLPNHLFLHLGASL